MKVFVFDLLPYAEHLDHLKEGDELPWPLPRQHFRPEVAVRTYAEHLEAWEELDRLGYDGVGFNEHHTSPYGLMNSPNLMAAAASQRTKRLKLLIYGNLLPLHDPLRLAEELAMLDCMSNGRIISGFARGIPREHNVFGVPMPDSRARFEEAWEIVRRAWTEEVFSYDGKFWSYKDVAIWPRPVQQPHPPVWMPVTSSKESIEWAARRNIPITPGLGPIGLQEDIVRYYGECLKQDGHRLTPDHIVMQATVFVADSKAQALKEAGPYFLYIAPCSATAISPRRTCSGRPGISAQLRMITCGPRTWRPWPETEGTSAAVPWQRSSVRRRPDPGARPRRCGNASSSRRSRWELARCS